MTAYEHMEKHLNRISTSCIGWKKSVFTQFASLSPVDLLDAAVDIAWERLMPINGLERPALVVSERDDLILFNVNMDPLIAGLQQAA